MGDSSRQSIKHRQSRVSIRSIRQSQSGGGDFDSWSRPNQLVRPDNQVDVPESDLLEEIPKVLSTENKTLPTNLVIYSFKDSSYIPTSRNVSVLTIFDCDGNSIHIESDEAKKQIARDGGFEALTRKNPTRSLDTETIPPPRSRFGANVAQWHIYDSYQEDFARQTIENEKEMMKEKKIGLQKQTESDKIEKKFVRKFCQKYYEDPNDESHEDSATLLLLWKFMYDKCRKMNVTYICFNTYYFDLFAVCFGSYNFTKQMDEGYVCFFSIKNQSFPEYQIKTESGAMCCDSHKEYPHLLAIGTYNGNVYVHNLQVGTNEPVYATKYGSGKHLEAVSAIKWSENLHDGELNFFSLSSDGSVLNWVLMENKLTLSVVITLFMEMLPICKPTQSEYKLKASGTCMTFHPNNKEVFLVGTEDGIILKCSTTYNSKYLMVYHAHYLAVHSIDINKFNSNIFLSCSDDNRVKIWEDMRSEPLFSFDLGASVGDAKWAPYSSTVFCAVTANGRIHVFDLDVNKFKAICSQLAEPRSRNKLTRITFNNKLPFILVGDEKGASISLKLSPNLRLPCKPPKKQEFMDQRTLQVLKLNNLISMAREADEGEQLANISLRKN
ncbi:CLUMA_CG014224, isoform A [Clunio marinus]|uniref:CLUMA_CG014224, isoform A n=1 Tax=Clunio marinus TaxID=568069 RepID=A0A1J1IRN2_9DIPT|nr:CLUMA_CG014224, isoform A [Clunio marinus]